MVQKHLPRQCAIANVKLFWLIRPFVTLTNLFWRPGFGLMICSRSLRSCLTNFPIYIQWVNLNFLLCLKRSERGRRLTERSVFNFFFFFDMFTYVSRKLGRCHFWCGHAVSSRVSLGKTDWNAKINPQRTFSNVASRCQCRWLHFLSGQCCLQILPRISEPWNGMCSPYNYNDTLKHFIF